MKQLGLRWRHSGAGVASAAVVLLATLSARGQNCFSPNPADWPAPARPYFMVVVDSSGSMNTLVGASSSCDGYPSTRIGHAKCAVRKTVETFGEVNFGLAQFASRMTDCSGGTCYAGCTIDCYTEELNETGGACGGCGPTNGSVVPPGASSTIARRARGANILVPMPLDTHITPGNLGDILSYLDNDCTSNHEIYNPPEGEPMYGLTPLNGVLRDMYRYFQQGWQRPDSGQFYSSPLSASDPPCRSVNVILLTDGDETCDDQSDVVEAASALWTTGVTFGSGSAARSFHIPVYVINFIGGNVSNTDAIASAGGTSSSFSANNEAQLSQALANIVSNAIRPEVCNNTDDNCNGCIDEGYKHYCNRNRTPVSSPTQPGQCCNWTTAAQRQQCLTNYQASVTGSNPQGDTFRLPCYSPTGGQLSAGLTETDKWLCYNPGELCDEQDNNCEGTTPNASVADEGLNKCGGHCPVAESCNGTDDNCDGVVDNATGSSTPYSITGCYPCTPSAEMCDGCDNDCDGVADNGIAPVSCGLPQPPSCLGTRSCAAPQPVSQVGGCLGTGPTSRWGACSNQTSAEVCDGIDNDCDGSIDDSIAPVPCGIPGTSGLIYHDVNSSSQCVRGLLPCGGSCAGWIGPTQEVCDGIDNDCDGLVDGQDPDLIGTGQMCDGLCAKGTTACVNGLLICQSSVSPQPEVCDGLDNDCNGAVDDGLLVDAPSPGERPCWDLPSTGCSAACSFTGASGTTLWCPPAGASCHSAGLLVSPPCSIGELSCQSGHWQCSGAVSPSAEVCDGLDNNCDGTPDNGIAVTACGTDQGECQSGTQSCVSGQIQCLNAVGPSPEVCDGLDNDCDGVVDNGIAIGTPCTAPYDSALYPGPRNLGQCHPGVSECSPTGELICLGGVGPSAEVCDGLDNDCDGQVDEQGLAPDGVGNTANPQNPSQHLGEPCGQDQGACQPGVFACQGGQFICDGAKPPQPEVCDCLDNDCDGLIDEEPEASSGEPALCSSGKACVEFQNGCQCAAPCGSGEFPCPTGGYLCQEVDLSGTEPPQSAGQRCVIDRCSDCPTQTRLDSQGQVECAPAQAQLDAGQEVPACVCVQNECHRPCYAVSCPAQQICTDFGPRAGQCVEDNCWNRPCGTGQVCNLGSCVNNPCQADSCPADQVCRPSQDFSSFRCEESCAGQSCEPGQVCHGGQCVESCAEPCEAGLVCGGDSDAAGCVASKCPEERCQNGSYCDPLTGACGNEPCEGVLCPSGQQCVQGQCGFVPDSGGQGGSAGADVEQPEAQAGSGGEGGSGAASGGAGAAGFSGSDRESHGNWGLATGGGGCTCASAPGARLSMRSAALAFTLISLVSACRRRERRERYGRLSS